MSISMSAANETLATAASTTSSSTSTLSEAEEEKYQKRLSDKNKPYYYGYDIEKEANEIVYPVLDLGDHKPITLNEARARDLQLYPKRNVYLMQKLQKMVVGMENRPIPLIYGGLKPLTEANDDDTTIKFILEDLEKEKKVVRVYSTATKDNVYHPSPATTSTAIATPTITTISDHYTYETPAKEYSKTDFKWYTIERAEADGVLEIRCKAGHCSKVFKTNSEMNKHFAHVHVGKR